jgi:type VI secretion system protein ImpK
MKAPAANAGNGDRAPSPVLNRVEIQLPEDSFLLAKFEEFYLEVVRLKSALAGTAANLASSSCSSKQARQSLLDLFRNQKAEVECTETLLGVEMYRQAQHVMACLADEIFSALYRTRGAAWTSLEAELFGKGEPGGLSRGGSCLRKLDLLLLQDDPVYRELASVYFHALALRGPGHRDTDKYLGPLFKMIAAPEQDAAPQAGLLFPQSYAHTLAENKTAFLPSPKKWLLLLASILLVWIAVSSALWVQVSGPVSEQLHEIQRLLPR